MWGKRESKNGRKADKMSVVPSRRGGGQVLNYTPSAVRGEEWGKVPPTKKTQSNTKQGRKRVEGGLLVNKLFPAWDWSGEGS